MRFNTNQLRRLSAVLVVAVIGCGGKPAGSTAVTFGTDVAPIFNDKCNRCHQPGGVAPFRLDTYESAKMMAPASLASIEARRMPPFAADPSGACGDLDAKEVLTDAEKATVRAWVEGGLQAGPTPTISLPPKPALNGAVSFQLPTYTPAKAGGSYAEFDDYRCFLVDNAPTKGKYITGYDVVPGTPEIVHHVLLLTVNGDEKTTSGKTFAQRLTELDAASPDRLGWPCFSGVGGTEMGDVTEEGIPVDWAPGQGIVEYPAATGIPVGANTLLVAQVHFNLANPANEGKADSSVIKLRLADTVERKLFFALPDLFLATLGRNPPASLPPMQPRTAYNWKAPTAFLDRVNPFAPSTYDVLKIFPHMHQRGRNMTVKLNKPDGTSQCLVQVTGYDFNWQRFYTYNQPLRIPTDQGYAFDVTCEYDTSGDTSPVLPGWGTRNEMCLPIMMVAVAPGL